MDAEATERAVHGAGRQAARRRSGGALERGHAVFQPVNTTLTACFSKKLNCAKKTIDTKVVDETSLYNICKGLPMFFLDGLSRNAKQSWGSAEC
jgi:hypothetical protein